MRSSYAPAPTGNVGVRLTYILAAAGLAFAILLLSYHVRRRLVEVELAVPMILLLAGGSAIGAMERAIARSRPLAPLIAIVGCDGAGKSTLSTDIRGWLAATRPVENSYLGLGSGELGRRIAGWPLIGAALERRLARKAGQTRDKDRQIPGLLTAIVVFGFSLLRLRRFRRALALRRCGITVVTDRYPQTEVAGFYDGPGLSAARGGSRAVRWLAARERRMYEWMAEFRPDLVVRLNIDTAVALQRKPDHEPDLLRAKVAVTPSLRFHGARIVDIDARADYDVVRRHAIVAITPVLARADRVRATDRGRGYAAG